MIPRRLRRPLWTAWNTWLRDSTDDNWTTFEAARNDALEVIHAHT
jgi:hypothetical protein